MTATSAPRSASSVARTRAEGVLPAPPLGLAKAMMEMVLLLPWDRAWPVGLLLTHSHRPASA